MRDQIELALETAAGPMSTQQIAREIDEPTGAVRECLGSMYTHHVVERERHADGHAWLWSLSAARWDVPPPPPPSPPYEREPSYNEQQRVETRVRRMLAAKRGEPEPMSGAPRRTS